MSDLCILLMWLTMAVLAAGIFAAWIYYRSALHPMITLGTLLLYGYGIGPLLLKDHPRLMVYFTEPWQLEYVQLVNLLGILFFTLGAMARQKPRHLLYRGMPSVQVPMNLRPRLVRIAIFLGILGSVAYWQSIDNVGGFVEAYNSRKGGGWTKSGYSGEAPLLLYPAIMILGLAARRERGGIPVSLIFLGLFFALPQLLHGIFGGRRGPLFLILMTLILAWFIARQRRLSIPVLIGSMWVVLAIVIVVWTMRQTWYIGSEHRETITRESIHKQISSSDDPAGHYYTYAAGMILNARYHDSFYWGKRYLVTLFIRPIPSAWWPTKYEDTLGVENPLEEVLAWRESLGWEPLSGSACGFIADAYLEFAWGCLVIAYLMGRFCAWVWSNSILRGGIWTVMLMEICILGVYLPTQSLSAFWHRFLFMVVPTWLIWRHYVLRGAPRAISTR